MGKLPVSELQHLIEHNEGIDKDDSKKKYLYVHIGPVVKEKDERLFLCIDKEPRQMGSAIMLPYLGEQFWDYNGKISKSTQRDRQLLIRYRNHWMKVPIKSISEFLKTGSASDIEIGISFPEGIACILQQNEGNRLAERVYTDHKFELAFHVYGKELELDPKNVRSLILMADDRLQLKKYDEAIEFCDKVLETDLGNIKACIIKGNTLNKLGRALEAIAVYDKALQINPKSARLWERKGNTLGSLGRTDEGNEAFNRELEINLEDIQNKVNNNKFLKVSEWGGADVIICNKPTPSQKDWIGEQPIVISFQNTEPRRRLVITNHSKELSWLFEQLRDIFQGRIDSGSKYDFFGSLAQAAMDCLEETKGEVECKILLTKVIDAAKKFGEQLYLLFIDNMSSTLYNEKRFAESVELYDNRLQNKPNNDGLWHGKGYALYRLNRYEDAIQALEKGLEINPDNSLLWVGKGYALFYLGRYDEAVEAYDRAITLDQNNPKNAVLRESKGDALCHLKKYEEAIVVYEEIIAINPGNPRLWDKKVATLRQLGKLDDAEKCSLQADNLLSKKYWD